MGRWGDGIYESDSALNYLATITQSIERELAYWLSPEQVSNSSEWLAQILTVTELVLLFEQHYPIGGIQLETQTVERWRNAFFHVWDGKWEENNQRILYQYEKAAYRQEKRPALAKMFDRLTSIAHYWEVVGEKDDKLVLVPLPPDYPVPYFSINHWIGHDNKAHSSLEQFTYQLLKSFAKDIIYYLSPETRTIVERFTYVEAIWVAVDLLAFLCTAYEYSPGVNEKLALSWHKAILNIEKEFVGDELDETHPLFQNAMSAFDRLEAVAKKYPPIEW